MAGEKKQKETVDPAEFFPVIVPLSYQSLDRLPELSSGSTFEQESPPSRGIEVGHTNQFVFQIGGFPFCMLEGVKGLFAVLVGALVITHDQGVAQGQGLGGIQEQKRQY
jgi:hypothetical protein